MEWIVAKRLPLDYRHCIPINVVIYPKIMDSNESKLVHKYYGQRGNEFVTHV
jgi:hypothetical protein